MYDVANRASFEELQQWLAEAADFGAGGIPMAVCANKVGTHYHTQAKQFPRLEKISSKLHTWYITSIHHIYAGDTSEGQT